MLKNTTEKLRIIDSSSGGPTSFGILVRGTGLVGGLGVTGSSTATGGTLVSFTAAANQVGLSVVTNSNTTSPSVQIQNTQSSSSSNSAVMISTIAPVPASPQQGNAGLYVSAVHTIAIQSRVDSTTNNIVVPNIVLSRTNTGTTAAAGIGHSINWYTQTTTNERFANSITSKLTDATDVSRTSQLIIAGVNNAVTADLFTLSGSGALKLNNYTTSTFTGTAVNTIQSDASGNIIQGSLSAGIKASADLTAQAAGVSSIATFTPSADGTFRIGAYVNVTAIVTNVITLKVTYTDENSNAVTQIIPLTLAATGAVGTTATVVGNNSATDIQIRGKSGSAITVLTTATGVGSETYDVGATIEQLR